MLTEAIIGGELGLAAAAAFTGAALYIVVAEHPARLQIEDRALLAQWRASYVRGFAMQASLALMAALLGLLSYWFSRDWRWIVGALVIFANWPYTLMVLLPLNNRLQAIDLAEAPPHDTRALIETWGHLHAVRAGLGLVATLIFLWAMNGAG